MKYLITALTSFRWAYIAYIAFIASLKIIFPDFYTMKAVSHIEKVWVPAQIIETGPDEHLGPNKMVTIETSLENFQRATKGKAVLMRVGPDSWDLHLSSPMEGINLSADMGLRPAEQPDGTKTTGMRFYKSGFVHYDLEQESMTWLVSVTTIVFLCAGASTWLFVWLCQCIAGIIIAIATLVVYIVMTLFKPNLEDPKFTLANAFFPKKETLK